MKPKLWLPVSLTALYLSVGWRATANDPDLPDASIRFSIQNAGLPVNGTISGLLTHAQFNPANLTDSRIVAQADVATLQTGIRIRDKHLKNSDYFDLENHPRIHLSSTAFRQVSNRKFIGQFALTIKGITKKIAIPFTVRQKGNRMMYQGSFSFNRLNFNLGQESVVLSNVVTVMVSGEIPI
jgi:polyisoprenoid-binding protein YceI